MIPDPDDSRAYLVAKLEVALADVRAGRVAGVACVLVDGDGTHDAWWATADRCIHAGAALRAAVTYLGVRMDTRALMAVLAEERESDPALS
jgi:hypothetical protein